MTTPAQGEIWWAEADDKRRPVLVVTRNEAIPVLQRLVIAPVTTTVRSIPTEIAVGPEQGLPVASAASFDNLQPVKRAFLTQRIGEVSDARAQICKALSALADC